MTKFYDLIVVGAGPAGIMAAKVAAQNGLSVVLLERKKNIPAIGRSCATMFAIEDDYLFGERMFFNDKQKRLVFPVNGFSVSYDGPHKNFYGQMLYAPDGKACLKIGDYEENLRKGDSGRLSVVYDKETLLRGMLREAEEMGAQIIPGMNVNGVTRSEKSLTVTTMTDNTFEGTFVIAADGLNSRIADVLGLNKKRIFYGTVTTISYEVTGVSLPAPYTYKMTNIFEEKHGIPLTYGIVPKATGDETFWFFAGGPADERIDYEEEIHRFMKSSPFSSWFEKAQLRERKSAILNFWSPIEDPYCDNVLVVGDAAWSIEAEITGSIMCGWKAANTVTLALRDNRPNREGLQTYLTWWKDSFLQYDYKGYLRSLAMLYVLNAEDVRYVYSLLDKPLSCTLNPHKLEELMNAAILERLPVIQTERPDLLEKFQKIATEPLEDLLKVLQ
ncbi:MAG: NAD(P)/FAD-dependent oxidoreductase [Deltaproteobacteria bacterium]|nr:NAD(P)/FAD-dependent oxidoreductase [Deltaproteobacteria bacterium]